MAKLRILKESKGRKEWRGEGVEGPGVELNREEGGFLIPDQHYKKRNAHDSEKSESPSLSPPFHIILFHVFSHSFSGADRRRTLASVGDFWGFDKRPKEICKRKKEAINIH